MKKHLTSGKCPKCGKQLKTSDVKGYAFVCEECDENFYTLEVKENFADFFEINIEMTNAIFINNLDELKAISDKYKCSFFGHDDNCQLTDFGWDNSFPDSDTLNNFIDDIEKTLIQTEL